MSDNANPETGTKSPNKFTHVAYAVIDRGENKDARWREIGIAFPHKDGKGFDILCDVLPLSGRITIRVPSEKK